MIVMQQLCDVWCLTDVPRGPLFVLVRMHPEAGYTQQPATVQCSALHAPLRAWSLADAVPWQLQVQLQGVQATQCSSVQREPLLKRAEPEGIRELA